MDVDLALVEARLGHVFTDRALLLRALTHKSLAFERLPATGGVPIDNEQLEFLGDSILGFLASEHLLAKFPDAPEGRLSKLKAQLVSAQHLHEVARQLGLGEFLQLGRGEELSGGRAKPALLANAVEALIAALYLDAGLEAARALVRAHILRVEDVEFAATYAAATDYKSALQERVQAMHLPQPRYAIVSESGPEHAKTFLVEARVGGGLLGRGEGTSKKAAGQQAARVVLAQLDNDQHP